MAVLAISKLKLNVKVLKVLKILKVLQYYKYASFRIRLLLTNLFFCKYIKSTVT